MRLQAFEPSVVILPPPVLRAAAWMRQPDQAMWLQPDGFGVATRNWTWLFDAAMFDDSTKGPSNMLATLDGSPHTIPPERLERLPPDWFPSLAGDLSYAAAHMTQVAERLAVTAPPLPPLPGDPRDRIIWRLRQARFDVATVRALSERLAARQEARDLGVQEVVHRLSGQFLSGSVLRAEAERNLPKSLRLLSRYLEGFEHQLDDLLSETEPARQAAPIAREAGSGDDALGALIARAGGAWSLAEAATHCGLASKQAMHARLKAGTAFGLVQGREYRLPRAQFVEVGEGLTPLPGLAALIRLFRDFSTAGAPLLEFLITPVPHLDVTPREALRTGRIPEVLAAARAFLDLDDESPPPS